ncbi:MAG: TonB-dependent receptor [Prevotella sp.]|nr:TonB-dependent receptor [Prevotella sp.]
MNKKLKLTVMALCYVPLVFAQTGQTEGQNANETNESAFTFTEAQLGEDDDMSQNVTIISSNNNIYASEVGFLFSPVRFRYRAFNQKYNDVYINGVEVNDMESGQFRYSLVGGLNQQTKNQEFSLPFESNNFSMSGMAGSNNYNFRPAQMPAGHRVTLSGANRNYTLRGMYTYNSGLNNKGWAYSANLTYRWAGRGYVEGTFYNSLSYFLGVQKVINDNHSLSLVTWGNPTERASQGASTEEMYWLANDRYYNPYWGYQNGKKRNSRVVNDFAPTAVLTWDWDFDHETRITTSLLGKYSMYQSTKLNYNNSDNPQPDYWKLLPSSYFNVWDETDEFNRTQQDLANWTTAYSYLSGRKADRQIDFDRLIYSNRQVSAQGGDAMYFIQAKHNDVLNFSLSSTLNTKLNTNTSFNLGILFGMNNARHYQTMEDLLGASVYHNINTYALGNYSDTDDRVQYDLNNRNGAIKEGDVFGYDYYIKVNKGTAWTSISTKAGKWFLMAAAKISGTGMQRDGKMRNGMAAENSYGKSGTATFLDGGAKAGATWNVGRGHIITLGAGYEWKAPTASTAFAAPEINNDFVTNLKNERVLSTDLGYSFQTSWIKLNLNGYYSLIDNATEWQNFYYDDINSFSYVSLTDQQKAYYGVEAGARIKVTSAFDVTLIGTMSEAKNMKNAHVRYMNSTSGVYVDDECLNKGHHENGTPLTAASIGLSYHSGGWFLDLNTNWYDRIYLSSAPCFYYKQSLDNRQKYIGDVLDNEGNFLPGILDQAKGHGGFMVDTSIGRSIRMKKGSLSINLSITNLLNNQNITTWGYEQGRSDYSSSGKERIYKFSKNPKVYYAFGTNGMLNIAYKF